MGTNSRALLAVGFFVAALVGAFSIQCNFNSSGDVLHDFKLDTWDGSRFYMSNHRGKIVVMVFWSVHCVPCHRQLGVLRRHALVNDKSVTLVSVCVDPEDRALVEQGVKITDGRIPVLLDHKRTVGKRLRIKSEPTTLVIDDKGSEIRRFVGYDSTTLAQIEKVVALLKQGSAK